jgi:hypothetical protein
MKKIQSYFQNLIVCSIALALVTVAQAQTQGTAKVIRVKGSARYTTDNSSWQPLKANMVIKPGTTIQTGIERGSYVDIVTSDSDSKLPTPAVLSGAGGAGAGAAGGAGGSGVKAAAKQNIVRLWENTLVGVDKLTTTSTGAGVVSETELNLKAGRVIGSVNKLSAGSTFEIKLPNGVAGIRGTDFEISSTGVLKVISGEVVLAFVNASTGETVTVRLRAGDSYNTGTQIISQIPQADILSLQTTIDLITRVQTADTTTVITVVRDQTKEYVSPTE